MQQPRSMVHYYTFIIALKFNSLLIKLITRQLDIIHENLYHDLPKICPHCLVFLLHNPEILVTFSMR